LPGRSRQPAYAGLSIERGDAVKWEYLVSTYIKREWMMDELNKLGEEEWEAVAIMDDGHVLMKRPKRDQSQLGPKRQRAGF
jgi:hypothetical protein